MTTLTQRVDDLDWPGLHAETDAAGCAQSEQILTAEECGQIADMYEEVERFRSTVDMARHRFGSGQYRYFDYPLPEVVAELRAAFYPNLLPVARDWAAKLRQPSPWPDTLDEWLDLCHEAGQKRATPILLSYGAHDWNALHRDLYGELVFPLQVVIGLDRPGVDHEGGEFMLVEQRPRAQSRGTVTTLRQGHALIFTTRDRPVRSTRGWSTGPVRHGVSTIRRGRRRTLGLVLHDAE
ncbi:MULTISPECIES: 2OG-Fe(II) oxygenase [unclassified Rhodococcus (in: high G+C Gram-positive bacteria)]|uniref:2OG-Fe(II) oxygenase n=1 Tax=unclassified Rhodococcus (in: high G+C Gram-positive bacteria) TaxID=192944 RepID=UPI00163A5D07|nr:MULTISPECIES: 2OG-Fe(II) oxygenase [unclassified Rhodococcus (in: high G+C Gram-positive bacteria)]MBC2642355.1 2OG-Fe(II) oxygenase [Rhodococcus sp. 3A]MBC2892902.1 2OG-Fe(II) oxygenase [Rhodococcus sp. 4CII]